MTRAVEVLVLGGGRPYCEGDMLDHRGPLVFTVAEVMTPAECERTIARIEALGPHLAPISTALGFVERPEIRNNQRVMFDDPALAEELFARVRHALPERLCGMRPVGANERFRCYRYEPGQRFGPHYDGAFVRGPEEESLLTFMVYLNEGCVGGETAFLDVGFGVEVTPRCGTALLFQHRLLHMGSTVTEGRKYVLRSDVMYRR